MAGSTIIRCPVCLASQTIASGYSADKQIHCGNCHRDFTLRNALPVSDSAGSSISAATAAAEPASALEMEVVQYRNPVLTWLFGFILFILLMNLARPFMLGLKGPGFLFFYGIVLVGIFVGLQLLRKLWEDSLHVSLVALILFEALGVVRYIDGTAIGMHRFGIMFIMMGLGGVLMFMRFESSFGSSSSSSCSWFGGCSSCSGCGGGCGGCGGCGG